jgi:RNA polymerase sigma-70 factor (ECF subfamily)
MRARKRMGMERIELDDDDYARIEALGDEAPALALVERLAPEQRQAITAHVVEERGYGEIAAELDTSEAVVRKRVSRGLATMRDRMGMRR